MVVRTARWTSGPGRLELGRTLPALLAEAVSERPNGRAFNDRPSAVPGKPGGPGAPWTTLSNGELKRKAEAMAAGLRSMGLERGDRVALFTHSDMSFVLADMACLIAGLVDVPIYLTHTPDAMRFILSESGCAAVLASDEALLARMLEATRGLAGVKLLAPAAGSPRGNAPVPGGGDASAVGGRAPTEGAPATEGAPSVAGGAGWPEEGGPLVTDYAAIIARGERELERRPDLIRTFAAGQQASDVATIIYTSGTTGSPKGVMLSHENLSSNAIASLTDLPTFLSGAQETVLSFLPLTHIFARTLMYANMWFGSTVYFGTTDSVREDLQEVRPTFMAAVPRVLEKSWERIEAVGTTLTGVKKVLYARALAFADAFDVSKPSGGLAAAERALLDRLVYSKWRAALGGRLKTIIVGGAALRGELVNRLGAAGIDVLQGYGLTETSPVICFNRSGRNRAGTVGEAIPGVEIGISDEDEILTRGPHVMLGYFARPDETAKVIDADGWFHTGDLGKLDDDGYLAITGRLKNLFKLSTGKYVMPDPITERLEADPLVATAIVVGPGEKFCAALLFLDREVLAQRYGPVTQSVLEQADVAAALREAVRRANAGMPDWSSVKRAAAVLKELTMADGSVTPKLSIRRDKVVADHAEVVRAMYAGGAAPAGVRFVDLD
ncbi:MAG: long-chain fatty acid--CoA ligase [Trueperaceae bacterium]|nr:long-chain fatty acid--CoA ligase [Trueperaceae bacterium]MCC6310285.1 long-chain fatty acid--CoA ligase [Trueperaceae bacterium]MCO5173285.1 AMP-dependent synthetase/ligase [Trueperaceae bacterium]MCW5818734.1 long-chain fatty acid--CoA ligase [Trueperaceae bacterium]